MRLVKTPKEAWFPVPGDEDGAEILVTHLTPGELADIQDAQDAVEVIYRQDGEKMTPEMRAKRVKGDERYAVIVAAVKDWKNILDEDGKPLKCTDANKIAIARMSEDFGAFVGRCREKLTKEVKEAQEAAEKN